jgi:hypothetical protein
MMLIRDDINVCQSDPDVSTLGAQFKVTEGYLNWFQAPRVQFVLGDLFLHGALWLHYAKLIDTISMPKSSCLDSTLFLVIPFSDGEGFLLVPMLSYMFLLAPIKCD